MSRVLFAIFAGLICGVLGMRQAQRLKDSNLRLHRWEILLQHLCLLLQESSLSLPEAFRQIASENTPADELLRRLADDMQQHPLLPLPQLYQSEGPEGPTLSRLMDRLSRGSLDSRVQAVEQAAQEIALLSASTQQRVQQDARMWLTLGWTCGACLTLLLL